MADGYWGADGIWYQFQNMDDYVGMEYKKGKDGSLCDECESQNENHYDWCDDYTCGDYYTYCSDLYGELDDFDISQFLECSPYENEYGDLYYIGPHCQADGYSITLGVYADEYCDEYVGDQISLYDVLGYNIDEEFDFFPQECVSCEEGVSITSEFGLDTYAILALTSYLTPTILLSFLFYYFRVKRPSS